MSTRHALITGGAGFIGSHLVDELLKRGFEVTVLDCLLPQIHGDAEMAADGWPVYLDRAARRIKGNILDDGVFVSSLDGITHLVHLAASVGVGQSMTNIADYTRNNTMATAIMLDVLSRSGHGVERIAVASSMSVYGEGEYWSAAAKTSLAPPLRSDEQLRRRSWELTREGDGSTETLEPVPTKEEKPLHPASIYAINKRDHEEMFLTVGRALGIPTTALRLFNAYGSRQALSNPYTGVAAIFISRLLNGEPPLVFEDGEQQRDFVHVKDVAEAFATVLESDKRIWGAFNVGSGRSVSVNSIARTLARLLRKNIAPRVLNQYRVGDIRHCFADVSRIAETYAFRPRRDFEGGMEELISWVTTARKPIDRSSRSMAELSHGRMVV
ncbi:NAD-dependent epimerase/dehydratase family protein [Reyranella soli]|nr:NAD-dependent epimerase/dehydratase family protein [Reyranella soli]